MDLSRETTLTIAISSTGSGLVIVSLKNASGSLLGEIRVEERKLLPLSHALHHFFKERATSAEQIGKYRAKVRLSSDTMEVSFE